MKELKPRKKSLTFYYILVLAVMLLFNEMARPYFAEQQVEQVDYGTFMSMIDDKQIDKVDIKDNKILFTDKDDKSYKTGIMSDPTLVQRLHESGAVFSHSI